MNKSIKKSGEGHLIPKVKIGRRRKERPSKVDTGLVVKGISQREALTDVRKRALMVRKSFPKARETIMSPFGVLKVLFDKNNERDEAFWADVLNFGKDAKIETFQHKGYKIQVLGIPAGLDDKEIEEELNFMRLPVIKLTALRKKQEYDRLLTLKKILLFTTKFRVGKPKSSAILQCYNCQSYGHATPTCKNPRKCRKCSEPHTAKMCPNKGKKLCANCKGGRVSTSASCPRRPKASK